MNAFEQVPAEITRQLSESIERWHPRLIQLSHSLYDEPELGGQEFRSVEKVIELLRAAGFSLQPPLANVPTGFVATSGTGELVVAVCIEYDALPEIGQGCGHNVHGSAAVGAAIALAGVADALGVTVRAIGTPAEETTGGKVDLIQAGAFDDVACALMVHAAAENTTGASTSALSAWDVEFTGKPAHAAAAPEAGINALDALVIAQTAIALARQQLPLGVIVSLIVTEGGDVPNIIPARARASIEMRARTSEVLTRVQDRVRACLQAGAHATGATLAIAAHGHDFADMRQDAFLTAAYRAALSQIGVGTRDDSGSALGSTDMGNVSHLMPAIHPMLGYDMNGAVHHTREFASYGKTASADAAIATGAWGIAAAAATAANDPAERERLLQLVRQRAQP